MLFALWLYAFVRFMTRQRSGPGDDEARERGAALDRVIAPEGRSDPAGSAAARLTRVKARLRPRAGITAA